MPEELRLFVLPFNRGQTVAFGVVPGGDAFDFFEDAAEIELIGVPHTLGDGLEPVIRKGQQLLGPVDPQMGEVFDGAVADGFFEQAGVVAGA